MCETQNGLALPSPVASCLHAPPLALTSSCSHQAWPAGCQDGAASPSATGPGGYSVQLACRRCPQHSAPGLGGSKSRYGSAKHSAGGQGREGLGQWKVGGVCQGDYCRMKWAPGSHNKVKNEAVRARVGGSVMLRFIAVFSKQFMPSLHWSFSSRGVEKGQPVRSFPEWSIHQTLGPMEV